MEPQPARILIVDDEEGIRDLLRDWLEPHGYVCLMAADGEAALEALASEPVDLALFDLIMPGMTGMDLFQLSRSLYPEVRVIFITALSDLPEIYDISGSYDLVAKPMRMKDLLNVIEAALDKDAKPMGAGPQT